MNKRIGILGWKTGLNSFGITVPYFNFISTYGNVVVIEPNNEIDENLDLLILPGGADLSTSLYKQDKFDINIGKACPLRTYFIEHRLQKYIDAEVPLFGICLGHQILATHVGNKLDTHMYHETNEPDERYKRVHDIILSESFKFEKNLNRRISVNSIHHQAVAIGEKLVGVELIASHKPRKNYRNDTHAEALKYNDFEGYSVQWHPEEIYDEVSHAMIMELLTPIKQEENGKKLKHTLSV